MPSFSGGSENKDPPPTSVPNGERLCYMTVRLLADRALSPPGSGASLKQCLSVQWVAVVGCAQVIPSVPRA